MRLQTISRIAALAAQPQISGITPTSGPVGTSVTISGSGFGSPQGSSTVTFGGGGGTFAYSRPLTIDATKCGGADSSSFPVLISASDASLRDVAHGGHVQKSDGSDVLFYSDAVGATQLASEMESYDNVNGILVAWVQVANVSHTSNTLLYVFYGSTTPPARTPNPWDSHFAAVYHLSAAAILADSTSNANTLANGGATPTAGPSGGGASSTGNGYQYFKHPSPTGFPVIGSANTLEGWANYSVSSPRGGLISLGGNDGPAALAAEELLFTGGGVAVNKNGAITQISAPAPSANAWHHFAYTTDGASHNVLYVDGAQVAANAVSNDSGSTGAFRIFGFSDTYQPNDYAGKGDEFRVSTIARSASWIQTEYNNENAPGNIGSPGFLTWGSELPTNSATVTNWTPTSITATVPNGATTGSVVVTVGGVAAIGPTFTVPTLFRLPVFTITSTHMGHFLQGQNGATYTVAVGNPVGGVAINGTVTVTETVPTGMTLVSMAGTGWTCTTLPTCTRSDALAGGGSYPVITVTVNVATNAGTPLSNQVSVSGAGAASASGSDPTIVDVISVSGSNSTVNVSLSSVLADGATTSTINVTLKDAAAIG